MSVTGCKAVRYSPILDKEFSSAAAHKLEHIRITISENKVRGSHVTPDLSQEVDWATGEIRILHNYQPDRRHPGHGFLYIFTLGIIPAITTSTYNFEASYSTGDESKLLSVDYEVTWVQGWAAGVLLLFPGWEMHSIFYTSNHSERAFATAANRLFKGVSAD